MALQNQITILNELSPKFALSGVLVAAGGVSTIVASTPTKSADAATAALWGSVLTHLINTPSLLQDSIMALFNSKTWVPGAR